jgi:hypothetical protein
METRTDVVPQRIEHDVQTFAPREFRRRYEIGVPGDQHNSFYQSLVRKRCDIDAELDIDTL